MNSINTNEPALAITGRLVISSSIASFGNAATAHIKLEDTSQADGEAILLVETVIEGLSHRAGSAQSDTVVTFELPLPANLSIDPKNDYTVRGWIDLDGNGTRARGDLFSDQSYRVLTNGFGHDVTIRIDK